MVWTNQLTIPNVRKVWTDATILRQLEIRRVLFAAVGIQDQQYFSVVSLDLQRISGWFLSRKQA